MRVWVDMTASAHPLVFRPLIALLRAQGHEVEITARDYAHNLFLNWWAEAGPVALLAWLWIFGAAIWRSLRAARAGDKVAKGVFVALAGFALFSLADHPSNVDRVAIALWTTLGLAAGATPLLRRPRGAPEERQTAHA